MKALFVSHSISRAGWYRAVLPAMWGEWDWAAIAGQPPGLMLISSWVEKSTIEPDLSSYDVIVLQQVRGHRWAELIRKLRRHGVKVLYEIDDYVHGIRKAVDHDFSAYYTKQHMKEHEECMRACDGAIVSTRYLAERYERVFRDRPIYVCENGLDLGRYRLSKPARGNLNGRETVTILWAGATGHQLAVIPWLTAVAGVMRKHDHVSFVSIGQEFATLLEEEFPDRTLTLPFTALETYPSAMMSGDISIAPAGSSDWFKAKSDLRAYESAALGIPIVADVHYKNAVDDGETGILVRTTDQVERALNRLVEHDDLRLAMAANAKQKAVDEFSMDVRIQQWKDALAEVTGVTM